MIDWIKFKGSTEEEKIREVSGNLPILVREDTYVEVYYDTHDFGIDLSDNNFTHWAPINLPQEEKWERLADYYGPLGNQQTISETLLREFDNIYSILNELRKR